MIGLRSSNVVLGDGACIVGQVADSILDRDEWMRRTGPFYPGLVALCALTIVPLPQGLSPTRDDLRRSAKWFPVVGAAIGATMAVLAKLLLWLELVPAVVAILVIFTTIVLSGSGMIMAVARMAQRMSLTVGRTRDNVLLGVGILALMGVLAIRGVALLGTAPDDWGTALLCSETMAYWTVLFLLYVGDCLDEPTTDNTVRLAVGAVSLPSFGIGSAIAGGIAVAGLLWSGTVVLAAVVLVAAIAFALGVLLQRRYGGLSDTSLATIAIVCEIAVLLAFASAHPATISPWIQ